MNSTELHRALSGRRGEALLITRNNLAFSRALAAATPDLRWTVLTKDDLKGVGARGLLGRVRGRRWEAVVIEDRAGELIRRRDLYRLMLLVARARSRWLAASGDAGTAVEAVPFLRGWLLLGPRLAAEAAASLLALRYARGLSDSLDRGRSGPAATPPAGNPRVALLRTEFWFGVKAGGSVSHVAGVLTGMRRLGLQPRLWTTSLVPGLPPEIPQAELRPAPRPALVEEAAMAGFNRTVIRRLAGELRAFAPAVVYQRHGLFSLAGLALARSLGVPAVLEVNASEVWAREAWSRLQFGRLARRMERTAFRRADRLVLISEELVPTVLELGGSRDRMVVNPNGVDVERFDPADRGESVRRELGVPAEAVLCGFVGTFHRWHGVLFLAGLIPELVKRRPDLHFLFIGDGDLRPRTQASLAEAGAAAHARFTGLMSPDRVPDHLAACDILLSPHLPFEDGTPFFGSPTKLFEYLAAGRPVVASRLGQIGRIVEDGRMGRLVPPGDGEAFGAAILELASDPESRAAMGREARRAAETRYTWEANARRALSGLIALPETTHGNQG